MIDNVTTYCHVKPSKNGLNVDIVATVDGINPEIETHLVNWLGTYENLELFLNHMFSNPIIQNVR